MRDPEVELEAELEGLMTVLLRPDTKTVDQVELESDVANQTCPSPRTRKRVMDASRGRSAARRNCNYEMNRDSQPRP